MKMKNLNLITIQISRNLNAIKNTIETCDSVFTDPVHLRSNYLELVDKIWKNSIFLIAYTKKIAGYAAIYINDLNSRVAYITLIATEAHHQKMGVGKALLDRCELETKKRDFKKIKLEVNKENKNASHFYKKNGFQISSEASEHSFYMVKDL